MIKVNLLNPEKKDVAGAKEAPRFIESEKESRISTVAILIAVILTVGIIGGLYFVQNNIYENKKREVEQKKARKAELDIVLKTIDELEKTTKELESKVKIIEELKNRQLVTVKMMDQLADALPEWLWLTNLTFANGKLDLDGKTYSNIIIADFINNLKATNNFTDILFPGYQRKVEQKTEIFTFKLSCVYVPNLKK
jgi:type IV pilus assembly protein PilN